MSDSQKDILYEIELERQAQDRKWGQQNHHDEKWYRILAEEFGEIARGMNEHDAANIREEIVQTAAVCVAWLEALERRDA